MGRLPEAWIAPPATRELRGWVRHRAKLVGLRSHLKCQVHAVLAGAGVQVVMSDLFGVAGHDLLASIRLAPESRARVDSALRLITALGFEVELFGKLVTGRLRADPGYQAIRSSRGWDPCWRRCSSPRSAISAASVDPSSWPHGPGSPRNTTSPTPPCTAARSRIRPAPPWPPD